LRAYLRAMLIAAGELGYREVTAADVVARLEPGVGGDFDRHFNSVEECFAAAYEAGSEHLCTTLLDACAAEEDWIRGLRGALVRLFELVEREPNIARALLVEGRAADRQALRKHQEVIERFSHALDSARRESKSRHSSSPLTGTFIIGAIEFAVCSSLLERQLLPDNLWQELPELMHFAVLPDRGEKAAWAAYDETMALIEGRSAP
jgi:AcrR family transcriptional regulator